MGIFDGLISSSFKIDSDKRTVFYPLGIFGKGYILSAEKERDDIGRFIKRFLLISFPTLIGIGVGSSWVISFLLSPILIIYLILKLRRYTSELEVSNEVLTHSESLKKAAYRHSNEKLWFIFIISVLGILFCIIQVVLNADDIIIAIVGIFFFSACAFMSFKMICAKKQLTINSKGPR